MTGMEGLLRWPHILTCMEGLLRWSHDRYGRFVEVATHIDQYGRSTEVATHTDLYGRFVEVAQIGRGLSRLLTQNHHVGVDQAECIYDHLQNTPNSTHA